MRGGKGGEQKSQLCEAHTYRNTEDHTDTEAYTKHRNTHTKADRQKHRGTHIHRSTHTAHTHSAHTHTETHTHTQRCAMHTQARKHTPHAIVRCAHTHMHRQGSTHNGCEWGDSHKHTRRMLLATDARVQVSTDRVRLRLGRSPHKNCKIDLDDQT